jgi:hypothetical protein
MSQYASLEGLTEEKEIELLKKAGFIVGSKTIFRAGLFVEKKPGQNLRRLKETKSKDRTKEEWTPLSPAEAAAFEDTNRNESVTISPVQGKNGKIKGYWRNGLTEAEANYLADRYNLPTYKIPKGFEDVATQFKISHFYQWNLASYAEQAELNVIKEHSFVTGKKELASREKLIYIYIPEENRAADIEKKEKRAAKLKYIMNFEGGEKEKAMIVELLRFKAGAYFTYSNVTKELAASFLNIIDPAHQKHIDAMYNLLIEYGKDNATGKSLLWKRLWFERSILSGDVFCDEDGSYRGRITANHTEDLGRDKESAFAEYVRLNRSSWITRAKEVYESENKADDIQATYAEIDSSITALFDVVRQETKTVDIIPVEIEPISQAVTNTVTPNDLFEPKGKTEDELREYVIKTGTEEQITAFNKLRSFNQKLEFVTKLTNPK